MTDREMLELAAMAAGYDVVWHERWECFVHVVPFNINSPPTLAGQRTVWVPLDDDGDALRLAVRLHLLGQKSFYSGAAWNTYYFRFGNDPNAATRRAIVHAAAQSGKAAGIGGER